MYRETLQSQWDGLCTDFAEEYPSLLLRGEPPRFFQDWYHIRIHRWNSVVHSEGVLLEQVRNEAFSADLKLCMEDFRFKRVEPKKTPPVWIGSIVALILGIIIGLVAFHLLHWTMLRAVIVGVVLCALITTGYIQRVRNMVSGDSERLQKAYIQQLREYWPLLEAICRKYAIH